MALNRRDLLKRLGISAGIAAGGYLGLARRIEAEMEDYEDDDEEYEYTETVSGHSYYSTSPITMCSGNALTEEIEWNEVNPTSRRSPS